MELYSGGELYAMQLYAGFVGPPQVHAVGALDDDLLYVKATSNGELTVASKWGGPSVSEQALDVAVTGIGLLPTVWISGTENAGEEESPDQLLVERPVSGAPACKVWNGGAGDLGQRLLHDAAGDKLYVLGYSQSFSSNIDVTLLGFSASLALEHSSRLWHSSGDSLLTDTELMGGVAMVAGGICEAADGSSWSPCSGTGSTRSRTWKSAPDSLSPLTIITVEVEGSLGTPSSAVLDSGGGGYDLLAVVRELP
jgi:hypothetical protein